MSSAALFRVVQATRGALGIDEAERLGSRDPVAADLRLLLNAGYKRGAPAIRIEGDDFHVAEFEVYGPKMIASIRGLEDVLESRCVLIQMLRTTGPKGNLVVSDRGEDWATVRHSLYSLALAHFSEVEDLYVHGTGADGLTNRQAELWRPILAIAAFLDRQGAEGLLDLVKDYAKRKAADAQEAGLGEWEEALLLALESLTHEDGRATLAAKTIRDAMAELLDVGDELRPSWVGYAVKRIGLLPSKKRKTRTSTGRMAYVFLHDEICEIMMRYGIERLGSDESDDEKAGSLENPSDPSKSSEPFRPFRETQPLLPTSEESEEL